MIIAKTAAPRSAVIHAVNTWDQSHLGSNTTGCGRTIAETWAGEYNEAPAGDVTCKRCLSALAPVVAETDAARDAAAPFHVGQRVGILTGLQSASGAWVRSLGTVVAVVDGWNGRADFVVVADGEAIRYVYGAHLLTTDGRAIRTAAKAAGVPVSEDGWPVIGDPIYAENVNGTGDLLVTLADSCAVERARRVRDGECIDCADSRVWDDGTGCLTCREAAANADADELMGQIFSLITGNPWDNYFSTKASDGDVIGKRAAARADHPAGKALPLQRCEMTVHGHNCGAPVRTASLSPRCADHIGPQKMPGVTIVGGLIVRRPY